MKTIGRLFNVGLAKEATRGTAVAPTVWLPKHSLVLDDKITQVIDDTSVGVIEDSENAEVTEKWSDGDISGRFDNTKCGLILAATLGTEATPVLASGETVVYDHVFTVAENAQHPTLTISLQEPNSTGVQYALGAITDLEIDAALKKYVDYKMKFRANASAAAVVTPSYATTENAFVPQTVNAYLATNLAGLAGATAIQVKNVKLAIKKNLEDDFVLGQVNAVDRLNKQFDITGDIELMYSDRSYVDTILMTDTPKALRIKLLSTTGIGVSSFPTLTIDLAKVKFSEVARKIDNNNLVTQMLKFKAFYSLVDAKMLTATLRNLQVAAY